MGHVMRFLGSDMGISDDFGKQNILISMDFMGISWVCNHQQWVSGCDCSVNSKTRGITHGFYKCPVAKTVSCNTFESLLLFEKLWLIGECSIWRLFKARKTATWKRIFRGSIGKWSFDGSMVSSSYLISRYSAQIQHAAPFLWPSKVFSWKLTWEFHVWFHVHLFFPDISGEHHKIWSFMIFFPINTCCCDPSPLTLVVVIRIWGTSHKPNSWGAYRRWRWSYPSQWRVAANGPRKHPAKGDLFEWFPTKNNCEYTITKPWEWSPIIH